jgi:uncharacterized membrane protein YtjA (UPF0391 family)
MALLCRCRWRGFPPTVLWSGLAELLLRRSYIIGHKNRPANTVNQLRVSENPCSTNPNNALFESSVPKMSCGITALRVCPRNAIPWKMEPSEWNRVVNRAGTPTEPIKGGTMLNWAIVFFIVALIAAAFGFLGIAAAAVGIARILFFIFLILFLVSLVGGLARRA